MADDETSPLKAKLTDEANMETQQSISPRYGPPTVQPQQSALKIQLLKLLKSIDISEDTTTHLSNANSLIKIPFDHSQKFSYDTIDEKQILFDEAAQTMIHKLHDWIEQKGKPATAKVNELEMKCDTYEQKISSANLEMKTLRDEMNKISKDKHDLQTKYEEEKQYKLELKQTIEILQLHHTENSIKYEHVNENNTQLNDKIDELNKLNEQINNLKTELINITKLNVSYQEQNSSLKTLIQTKDTQINELTKDRNEWENNANIYQHDLVERLSEINSLRKENANYKHQIEILNNKSIGDSRFGDQLRADKTVRGLLSNGVSSAELSLEPNAFLPDKSMGVTGIYGQQSVTSVLSIGGGHHNRTSTDFDKMCLDKINGLEKQLKDERVAHEQEMEMIASKLEELKQKIANDGTLGDKYTNEIKELQEEIQRLKEENAKKSKGCNACVVM